MWHPPCRSTREVGGETSVAHQPVLLLGFPGIDRQHPWRSWGCNLGSFLWKPKNHLTGWKANVISPSHTHNHLSEKWVMQLHALIRKQALDKQTLEIHSSLQLHISLELGEGVGKTPNQPVLIFGLSQTQLLRPYK